MARPGAPMDLRTAISFRFSITTIMRVATILKAATSTISNKTMKYTVFSKDSAAKRLRLISVQSRAVYGKPSLASSSCATACAWYTSWTLTSTPVTCSPSVKKRWASASAIYTKALSYSNMPESNTPTITKRLILGTRPPAPGVALRGEMILIGSLTETPS